MISRSPITRIFLRHRGAADCAAHPRAVLQATPANGWAIGSVLKAVTRLCELPPEWSRQYRALGLTAPLVATLRTGLSAKQSLFSQETEFRGPETAPAKIAYLPSAVSMRQGRR
jgi:hypothetical protein